jgi:hypothetical protein
VEPGEPPPPTRAAIARKAEEKKLSEDEVSRSQGRRAGAGGPISEAQVDRESARGVSDKPQVAIRVTGSQPQSVIGESLPQTTGKRLVYRNDFTQPTGWDEGHSDKVKVFRLDGYYHIAVYDGPYYAWFNPALLLDDFKAQVDGELNIQSGKTADLCSVQKMPTARTFSTSSASVRRGFYRLHSESTKEARVIIDWQSTESINRVYTTNSLMIEKVEKQVTLGINGQIVATTTDSGLRPGHVEQFVRSYKEFIRRSKIPEIFQLYSIDYKQ